MASERKRRSQGPGAGKLCDVVAEDQCLPDWNEFYANVENPFIKCTCICSGQATEAKSYRASHEEADDRIMYSVQQIYLNTSKKGTVTVYSPDADIFIVLLYHLKNMWDGLQLYLLKKGSLKVTKKRQNELYPLNLLIECIDGYIIDQLPAAHLVTLLAKLGQSCLYTTTKNG